MLKRKTPLKQKTPLKSNNKFGAKRCFVDGAGYDSKAERDYRWNILELKLKIGEIKDIEEHKTVNLIPGINWKVDYSYTIVATGEKVWDEVKGVETEGFRLKARIWESFGPGRLFITKGSGNRFRKTKEIIPKNYKIVDFQNKKVTF